jgi:hypothetical protein
MTTGMEVFLVADTYPIQFKFGIFEVKLFMGGS